MMDERLIGEVKKHAIIYNRQRSNMINGDKCVTKELAWQDIARNLRTDAELCKKRWKYLRERYVHHKKVGGSPTYEHLSRPYLEKMSFLDGFIQSRKSLRPMGFINGPGLTNFMNDGNESSKSSSSLRLSNGNKLYRNDAEDMLSQIYQMNQYQQASSIEMRNEVNIHHQQVPNDNHHIKLTANNMPSSSSSIVSQTSPMLGTISTKRELVSDDEDSSQKRQRSNSSNIEDNPINEQTEILNLSSDNEDSPMSSVINGDTSDETPSIAPDFFFPFIQQQQQQEQQQHQQQQEQLQNDSRTRNLQPGPNAPATSENQDLLHSLFHQAISLRQLRSTEQLLGELVTSELMKMTKNRKKLVQRKILELLFGDDDD